MSAVLRVTGCQQFTRMLGAGCGGSLQSGDITRQRGSVLSRGGRGRRGEVSGHCIPQIIVTFVSTPAPAPAPAPAAAAAHSWNQRAKEDGEVATILVILNTHLYPPVLLCTLLDRIMNHNRHF